MEYNNLIKKGMNFSLILLFITGSFYSPTLLLAENFSGLCFDKSDTSCYGFLVPLPLSETIEKNPEIQFSVMNLINDMIRLEIPVYWSTENFEVKTKQIDNQTSSELRLFGAGTFIVPFTNCSSFDSKIIAIINDYNVTHELHKNIQPIEIMMLLEPVTLEKTYRLNEPRTACYYGDGVYSNSLNWYVTTLYKGGFLANRYLSDDEVIKTLNNDDFNVFIWPGGDILKDIASNVSIITRLQKQNEIRYFVDHGGGYIGSCYGAFAACSGTRFFPLPLLMFHFPHISTIGFLSIQDCFTALGISSLINITVNEIDHPVLYGVQGTIHNSQLRGGAVYTWLGKNTQTLGTIKEVNSTLWAYWFRDLFSSNSSNARKIIDLWIQFTTGKPVWTTSNYGNGKVVSFGDHPEIGHITQKRLIYNAMFYTTSTEIKNLLLDVSIPVSDVVLIGQKSNNISIMNVSSDIFLNVYESIDKNLNDFQRFQSKSQSIFNITWNLIENNTMNVSFGIDIFVAGMWEFIGTMKRSIQYLSNLSEEENTIYFLRRLDNINNALLFKNISINDSIDSFIEEEKERLNELSIINVKISEDLDSLEHLLNCYSGSNTQNESILSITNDLWKNSKLIEKKCPIIFFDTLKLLREAWYMYESA